MNITREYKKKIRQEMYYIQTYGLDAHMSRMGISDKAQYLLSLKGRIAFVLQTIPKAREFESYKAFLADVDIK